VIAVRESHPRERAVGMRWYASDADGTGGRLRDEDADFRVREVERFDVEPADADPGDYPHVVLRATLRGWDTNDFVGRLSDALGASRDRVSWAGTKDKHAITTQLFSVRGIDPEDVPEIDHADVAVVGRAGRALQFGDLAGNAFEITVADPERPEQAEAVAADLRTFGDGTLAIPNYFGQQRFGSLRPVTHEVGFAVVRGDFEGAVMAYLGDPSPEEPEDTRAAREFVAESRDWEEALEAFPGRLRYERSMLHELSAGGGFRDALERLPDNLRRLFVHAAQYALFNEILSERMARGLPLLSPVPGDVVCFADADVPEEFALPDTDRTQVVTERRVDTVARHCERGRAFVTGPLVGTETTLGEGEPGEITREVLADHDLAPADFAGTGEFDSTGTRRALALTPEIEIGQEPLSFAFSLPKGAYATTVAREFLKVDPVDLG